MLRKLLYTEQKIAGLILRFALAISIVPMGYLKITDVSNILGILQSYYGLPTVIAFLVIIIEFFSPVFLILGLFSKVNAALLGIVMLGAAFFHLEHGFYINWFGQQAGEGYQFHILAIGIATSLLFIGGGKWSMDAFISKKIK